MEQAEQKTKNSRKRKIITWICVLLLPIIYLLLGSIDTSKDDYSAVTPSPRTAPPDESNALHAIKAVYQELDESATWLLKYEANINSEDYLFRPDNDFESEYWEKILNEHEDELNILKQAYSLQFCYEKIDYDAGYPHLKLIATNRLLASSILYHIHAENWYKALEEIKISRKFSRNFLKQSDILTSLLVGLVIDAQTFEHINLISEMPSVPKEVIQECLNILKTSRLEILKQSMVRAFKYEFQYIELILEQLKRGEKVSLKIGLESLNFPFSLHYNRTLNAQAKISKQFINLMSLKPSQVKAELDLMAKEHKSFSYWNLALPNGVGNGLLRLFNPIVSKQAFHPYHHQVTIDLHRLKLALRLYFIQHGELPDELDEVYPFIGGSITDLYSPSNSPFLYSKSRARIWSCGSNIVDDGGSTPTSANSWNSDDIVLLLKFAEPQN